MSIRQSLLALLTQGPRYGYQLRAEFEERTGGTWPLNVGQVYTTLDRLERDGLIRRRPEDGEEQTYYEATDEGRAEAARWWSTPVERSTASRDELSVKLVMATSLPGIDIGAVIQAQRRATIGHLQELTRLKRDAEDGSGRGELSWSLTLDALIFHAEAEARWLDHCESRLRQAAHDGLAERSIPEVGIAKRSASPAARRASAESGLPVAEDAR